MLASRALRVTILASVAALVASLLVIAAAPIPANDTATVFIYREARFVGGAIVPTVRYDGSPLAVLEKGCFGGVFPVGQHTFDLDLGGGAQLNLEPQKTYYLRVDIVPGFLAGSTRLVVVEPAQGAYEIKDLPAVPEEKVRDHSIPWVNDPLHPVRVEMTHMRRVANSLRGARKLPKKLRSEPKDVWGTSLRYIRSDDGASFLLISAGSDRKFDQSSWSGPDGKLASSSEDAVMKGNNKAAGWLRLWDDQALPIATLSVSRISATVAPGSTPRRIRSASVPLGRRSGSERASECLDRAGH